MSGVAAGTPVARDRTAAFRSGLRWVLGFAGIALLVLLVSGLYLMWNYRPTEGIAWDVLAASPHGTLPETMRDIHHIASQLFLALSLVAGIMAVVLAVQLRKFVAAVAGCGFFLIAFSASVTGSLLPWDQVALRAVTVGTDVGGYWDIIDGETRYILIGSHELSSETFLRWFWVHTAVLPIALIGLAVLLLLTTRPRAQQSPDP